MLARSIFFLFVRKFSFFNLQSGEVEVGVRSELRKIENKKLPLTTGTPPTAAATLYYMWCGRLVKQKDCKSLCPCESFIE